MSFVSFDMAPGAPPAAFSPLELIVIAASAGDGPSSLEGPGRGLARLRRLFGGRGKTRLADPRLEALRRMAVLLRHRGDVGAAEIERFTAAGFTPDQYDRLRSMIGEGAPTR